MLGTGNELTRFENARPPDKVMTEARVAVNVFKGVLEGKPKKIIINGEQYLEYEDWQTLGEFYRVSTVTRDAVPVDVDGVKGAKAHADLVNIDTGIILGGAEAYCLRDEENWKDKPWFQLASMAQTRAGAKAFRNRLAWVAVLAGYRPTPAEEMVSKGTAQHWCKEHNCAFREYRKGNEYWFSHKTSDGGWCNEEKKGAVVDGALQDETSSEVKTEGGKDIPEHLVQKTIGGLFQAGKDYYGMSQGQILEAIGKKDKGLIVDPDEEWRKLWVLKGELPTKI